MLKKTDNRIQIEKDMEDNDNLVLPRPYLGMSTAGHECARYMWYSFRWCFLQIVSKQHQRIFDRGHLEEPRVLKDLKEAGYDVSDTQLTLEGFAGHNKGHCDGVILLNNKKHVLEIKTMKQEKFKTLKKDKLKSANPGYWGQAQMYMHALGIEHTLFIVTNKNTEERYYEVVDYDETQAQFFNDRIVDVISTEVPPTKIGNADWFQCKWCDAMDVCHYGMPHLETCRTCQNIILKDEGKWGCSLKDIDSLTVSQQEQGCEEYVCFESLSEASSNENA